MTLQTGEIFGGKYHVVRRLHEGEACSIYEAKQSVTGRAVALKVSHRPSEKNRILLARFPRAATIAARLASPNVVEILEYAALDDGRCYLAMELLEGETLGAHLAGRVRLSARESAALMVQALAGLGALHSNGIVHRDIKPNNIFLVGQNGHRAVVKIIDFLLAKVDDSDPSKRITRDYEVFGTPYYMSPEQAKASRDVSPRSDLYSLGVVLYEAVTGRLPFDADTNNELLFKIILEPFAPPQQYQPDLDPAFSALICKAMARDPDARFPCAEQFAEALKAWT